MAILKNADLRLMHTLCMTIKAKNFIKPQIISGLFRIPKQFVIFHQKVGHLSSCVPNHEWLLSKVPLFSKTGPEKILLIKIMLET